jgi:hypothetical protein
MDSGVDVWSCMGGCMIHLLRPVIRASNVLPSVQISASESWSRQITNSRHLSRLNVGKIKDGQQPTPRGNDHFLSGARKNFSIVPTLVWQPAHPPPTTTSISAEHPAIWMQLEGTVAFTLVYLDIF